MANSPIVIPPFNNVPAPGSPIRSDWAQQITHYVVDTPGMVKKSGDSMTGQLLIRAGVLLPLGLYGTASDNYIGFYDSAATPARHGIVGYMGAAAYMRVRAEDAASTLWLEAQGNVVFGTGATYANTSRFDSGGNLLVGKAVSNLAAAGSEVLPLGRVYATVDTSINGNNVVANIISAVAGDTFASFRRSNTQIGSITAATTSSVAFNTTSDPRLKENLGPIPDAADRVQQLGSKAFAGRWKDADTGEADPAGEVWAFLSSHDVEDVAPYAVTGERDAVAGPPPTYRDADGNDAVDPTFPAEGEIIPQQVDYSALVPLLTAALAQALERIAALEAAA